MLRAFAICILLALPACAALDRTSRFAAQEETEARGELECMARCLSDGDGTCDACADHCFDGDAVRQVAEIAAVRDRSSAQ
jgi:hypothetical protein